MNARSTAPRRFARGLVAAASLISLLFLGYLSLHLWETYRHLKTTSQTQFDLRDRAATITHLDEVLTMSAHLAAATGDTAWEARYHQFEPKLDEAIMRVMAMAQEARLSEAIAETKEANARLVAMEQEAFARIHEHRTLLAQAILSSPEYWAQKERYRHGMEQITAAIAAKLQAATEAQRRASFIAILTISLLGPALIAAWLFIAWLIRRHLQERAQSESALRESHELLALFLRHSPIYAYIKEVTPTESRVLQASDNFERMIGIRGPDMVGKTMDELFPPDLAQKIRTDDWAVVSGGRPLELEEEFNGRSYSTLKFPIVQGEKTLLAGFTIDTTERVQAEAKKANLEARNRQLEKSESLGRMAEAIAHHLNNKLQTVMASLDLLKDPKGADPAQCLLWAGQAAERAAEISKLMLAYLGQSSFELAPCSLSAICRDSLPSIQKRLPGSLAMKVDCPAQGPVIKADAGQIRQVLTSLAVNASEAMDGGKGCLRLSVRSCPADAIPARQRYPIDWQPQEPEYACLEVADTGCGIGEADLARLFDPFFSTKFTGRGMGLPVVLGIVQAHGGAVTVESGLNRGSVFGVYLPLFDEAFPP